MFAGMMPALDLPGEMMPGQFGPMILVLFPVATACAQANAESCTGTPSVITTASPMPASMASMIASLVNAGGTNSTVTFAPVCSIASATDANTGCTEPSKSTLVPAFRAFTPPTMFVPEASIRRVCLVPSPPVMPCTMTREFSFRKIAIVRLLCLSVRLPLVERPCRRLVHGLGQRHQRVCGRQQDPSALVDVVAVQPHHQRFAGLVAQHLQGTDDPVRDRVAGGDATEHVDEHRLDVRVGEDDAVSYT